MYGVHISHKEARYQLFVVRLILLGGSDGTADQGRRRIYSVRNLNMSSRCGLLVHNNGGSEEQLFSSFVELHERCDPRVKNLCKGLVHLLREAALSGQEAQYLLANRKNTKNRIEFRLARNHKQDISGERNLKNSPLKVKLDRVKQTEGAAVASDGRHGALNVVGQLL